MTTIAELEAGLVKAHQAGNKEHAQIFANEIRKQAGMANSFTDGNYADDTKTQQLVTSAKAGFDSSAQGIKDLLPKNITDRVDAADAWLAKKGVPGFGGGAKLQQTVDAGNAYEKNTGFMSSIGKFGAEAVPYIATGIATGGASLFPRVMAQAATGFGVTNGDLKDKSIGGAMAGGGEYVGSKLVNTLGRVFRPINPTEEASRLIKEGVYPMPGQAAGGRWKATEDKLTSMPYLGDVLQYGRRNAHKEAIAAAQSKSGVKITPDEAGQAGFKKIDDSFDQRFADAKNGLFFDPMEQTFQDQIQANMYRNRVDLKGKQEIEGFFNQYKRQPGQLNTILGGDDTHAMMQQLRKYSADFRKSADPYQNRTGQTYRDMYESVANALETQGLTPIEKVNAFKDVRRDYANYVPSKKAGEGAVASRNDGIFTSAQFSNQVANNAKRMGNERQLRQGKAPMQEFGSDWNKVLGDKYPDSGTAGRLLALDLASLIPGGIAGAAVAPFTTRAGRGYMVGANPTMNSIAEALRQRARYGGATGASIADYINEEEQ
jgi:hypothetical protein